MFIPSSSKYERLTSASQAIPVNKLTSVDICRRVLGRNLCANRESSEHRDLASLMRRQTQVRHSLRFAFTSGVDFGDTRDRYAPAIKQINHTNNLQNAQNNYDLPINSSFLLLNSILLLLKLVIIRLNLF